MGKHRDLPDSVAMEIGRYSYEYKETRSVAMVITIQVGTGKILGAKAMT